MQLPRTLARFADRIGSASFASTASSFSVSSWSRCSVRVDCLLAVTLRPIADSAVFVRDDKTQRNVRAFGTIAEAEAYIDKLAQHMPDDVLAGRFVIDAPADQVAVHQNGGVL